MDVTDEGYSDSNELYERYYKKITSMTLAESNSALYKLEASGMAFNGLFENQQMKELGRYLKDWREFYRDNNDDNELQEKFLNGIYKECTKIYDGLWNNFYDFGIAIDGVDINGVDEQNKLVAAQIKKTDDPCLGIVTTIGHVGGIVLTRDKLVIPFNTIESRVLQKIVYDLSDGDYSKVVGLDVKDLQYNEKSNNIGCQTLLFMFAAPFLSGLTNAHRTMQIVQDFQRAMNYNEYILDGLALFAKAVVGVRHHPPPLPGFDKQVLADVVTNEYPSLLKHHLF